MRQVFKVETDIIYRPIHDMVTASLTYTVGASVRKRQKLTLDMLYALSLDLRQFLRFKGGFMEQNFLPVETNLSYNEIIEIINFIVNYSKMKKGFLKHPSTPILPIIGTKLFRMVGFNSKADLEDIKLLIIKIHELILVFNDPS